MPQQLEVGLDTLERAEGSRKERIRRGRGLGSGLGKTAGRGGKGQTARAGKGRRRGFEGGQTPLHRRLPKFGFDNPFRKTYLIVNLSAIEASFASGDTVDYEKLVEKGIVKGSGPLKILGEGSLTKKVHVKAHKFSKSAIQKINQAGGQAEEIKPTKTKLEETKGGSG